MVNKRKYASEQERLTVKADAGKRRRDNAKKDRREEMETLYTHSVPYLVTTPFENCVII